MDLLPFTLSSLALRFGLPQPPWGYLFFCDTKARIFFYFFLCQLRYDCAASIDRCPIKTCH